MSIPKNVSSNDVTSRTGRIPKSALLAGAALGLPLAAHADITTVVLNQTISSNDSTDATYELQVNGVKEFLFTASFANTVDTVTPQNSSGYVGTPRILIHLAAGRYTDARPLLIQLAAEAPENTRIRLWLAHCHLVCADREACRGVAWNVA